MSKFLNDYLAYTKEYESPTSFWKWSGIAAIGAVMRDNCYRTTRDTKLYASTYILLVAESGTHRKGRPVDLCNKLVGIINNTKIISGRASIQAIIEELSKTETDRKTGKLIKGGSAIFFAPEISAAIVEDPSAINILTDIYDTRPNYKTLLKSGHTKIENLVFSMLAASNETLLKGTYNNNAIQGGLLARTFLIIPSEFRAANALIEDKNGTEDVQFKVLVDELRKISELRGEFEFELEAKEEYTTWYVDFRNSYQNKSDKAGVVSRIHTGILKIALIYAAGDLSMTVKKCHVEEAITDCLGLIPNYGGFIMNTGKGKLNEMGTIVMTEMLSAKDYTISRKDLLRKHWNDFDGLELDNLMMTLQQGGLISMIQVGSTFNYQLTKSCLEIMTTPGVK